jgi:hypothetical protein
MRLALWFLDLGLFRTAWDDLDSTMAAYWS